MVSERDLSQSAISDDATESIHSDCCDGIIVQHNDDIEEIPPSFGNISVMDSSGVHFGNKTFYQGPVTIKQFLYANGKHAGEFKGLENGLDNSAFEPDPEKNEKRLAPTRDTLPEKSSRKVFQRLRAFTQQNVVLLVSVLSILTVALIVLFTVVLVRRPGDALSVLSDSHPSDEENVNVPISAPLDPNGTLTLPSKVKLVTRLEWLAQPTVQPLTPLRLPVPYVIIQHTATENCSSQAQCIFQVRYTQTFHIESRNWWDIGYNFLVGGDGEAYEGRGWKSEGAHTYGYNAKSIGIAFIGTFNTYTPPQRQILACQRLIAMGVELGYVRKDYKLLAHRQLQTTQSPGEALYKEMKSWPHWAEAP